MNDRPDTFILIRKMTQDIVGGIIIRVDGEKIDESSLEYFNAHDDSFLSLVLHPTMFCEKFHSTPQCNLVKLQLL